MYNMYMGDWLLWLLIGHLSRLWYVHVSYGHGYAYVCMAIGDKE